MGLSLSSAALARCELADGIFKVTPSLRNLGFKILLSVFWGVFHLPLFQVLLPRVRVGPEVTVVQGNLILSLSSSAPLSDAVYSLTQDIV